MPSASAEPDACVRAHPCGAFDDEGGGRRSVGEICLLTVLVVPSLSITVNVTRNVPPAV